MSHRRLRFDRLLAALAALALVATLGGYARPPVVAAATSPFTDIVGTTFEADIDWLYAEGITVGCSPTLYCPDRTVTRGEMASFLVRMFDLTEGGDIDAFTDDDGTTHEVEINRLAASGITAGCTATTYCPTREVRRDEMTSFLTRAIPLTTGAGNDYFRDDDATTHEANIDRAAAAGIASGCAVWRFCPAASVTRGQMAGFLHRVEEPITPPPYPAGGGVTLFVAVDGEDAGNGCTVVARPCRTIGHTLEKALEGDDISIGPGTFAEQDLTIDQDIEIRGALSGDTTIDGSGGEKLRILTIAGGRTVELRHLTVTRGWSASSGGGIQNDGNLTIRHSTIRNNHAQGGGGGISSPGTLTIEDSTIRWNSTLGSGGGVFARGITVRRTTFSGNTSVGGGGGAMVNYGAAMQISSSTFVRNQGYGGGAISNSAESGSVIANTTIAENSANGSNGGGISTGGGLLIANTTITGNVAGRGAGIFYYDAPASGMTLDLENVLVAGNDGLQDVSAAPSSVLASIIGIPAGLTLAHLLDPEGLQDNGGPTQTIAVTDSPANPAIGKGNTLTCSAAPVSGLDQRGRPRDIKCDIGAFEAQP